ncbi:MAG: transporter [Cyanobacteriota bacterium]|jgi:BASS family bile acid:Na+ symporter
MAAKVGLPVPLTMLRLLIPLTLFAIMFALGLGLKGEGPSLLRRRPALVLRVVIGSCVLVPLVALLLLHLPLSHALSPPARFAIALMAISPSAPLLLRKAGRQGGDRELASILQVVAALVAIVSIPLMADVFRASFDVSDWDIVPAQVAPQVAKAQLLPLLLGLALRRWRPALADRIVVPLQRLADLLLLLLTVLVLVFAGRQLVPFVAANALALPFMAAMVLASLVIGLLLAGRSPQERITTSLVTSMRNPGLALLFASLYGQDLPGVKLGILAYLLTTVILSIPFLRWRRSLRPESLR